MAINCLALVTVDWVLGWIQPIRIEKYKNKAERNRKRGIRGEETEQERKI